jgi:serine/threonine protein kinase
MVSKQSTDTTISNIVNSEDNAESISALKSRKFHKELDMYKPVVNCLDPIFYRCKKVGKLGAVRVSNTHGKRFLGGLAPDISIFRGPVTACTLCAFVEMKLVIPFTDEKYGQCMDYLYQMKRHQPGRKYYVGMLSSIKESTILVLTNKANHQQSLDRSLEDPVPRVLFYGGLDFQAALSKLRFFVESAEHNPPELPFSEGAGELYHVLGAPRGVALGIFPCPSRCKPGKALKRVDRGEIMAVKVALGGGNNLKRHKNETHILQSFADRNDVPFSVPLLVHNPSKHREIGIMPVGVPFRMRQLDTQAKTRSCLQDILSALKWIHDRGIVHRDVRLDNLVLIPKSSITIGEKKYKAPSGSDRPRAVLIDFDRATALNDKKEILFEGGYVCCPPTLLDRIAAAEPHLSMAGLNLEGGVTLPKAEQYSFSSQKYKPQKSDDFLSFVLVVLSLLIPHCFETFDYCKIENPQSNEFKRLRALWKGLDSSSMWSPMVKAAESSDVEQLGKTLDVFVML